MFRVSSTCALVLTDRQDDSPHDSRKVPKTATATRNDVADEVDIAHGYLCRFFFLFGDEP